MRSVGRAARVVGIAMALVGITAVAAWAHARLVRSEPARDARLTWPPDVIRLEFSEAVSAATSRIELVAPDSQRLRLGIRGDSAGNRKILQADVPPLPSPGRYRVEWRLIGPDGHAMSGDYSFSVDSIVARRNTTPVDTVRRREMVPSASFAAPGSPLQQSTRFLWIAALLVVLGSTSLSLAVLPRLQIASVGPRGAFSADVNERLRSWTVAGACMLLLLAVVRLASQAAVLSGTLQSIRLTDVTGIVTGSTWGRAWLVFVAATTAVIIFARQSSPALWKRIAGAGFLLAIASPFLGHPAATVGAPIAMGMDAIHVVAAGGWGGSLLMLALAVVPRAAVVGDDERACVLRALLRAFSPVALSCAFALLVTGSIEALLQLGGLSALWGSAYGQALLRKLVLVAIIAALGAWHWRFAQPTLGSERSVRVLRWSIAMDVGFLLAVLALTAILTGTVPPVSAS